MSLATKVLIWLGIGVVAGLLFGESIAFVGVAGTAFVLLLQMTVVPYIAVSLVAGLGDLSPSAAWNLAKRAGGFLLIFWGLALVAVVLMPLGFPDWPAASFFSTSLVERQQDIDLVSLFIPANPFQSLAEAIIPSVVVFSIATGLALMGVPGKEKILAPLGVATDALGRMTGFIVRLAPYGVFAIVAQAAGTMNPQDLKGLEVYTTIYTAMALVLALWVIPGLVAALTPFRYRDVVWRSRAAFATAFATANVFVVLAVLAEDSKALLRAHEDETGETAALVDVVVPTAFTLPNAGVLLTLSFVLFAGWVSGFDVPVTRYPEFLASGVATFFGSTIAAMPFLLDMFRIPADTFQLFLIADNTVVNRVGTLLAAVNLLALALLSASAMRGTVRFRPVRLLGWAATTVVALLAVALGVRLAFGAIGSDYSGYRQFMGMRPLFKTVETRLRDSPPATLPKVDRSVPTLDRIRGRGFLRMGYREEDLPYSFRNEKGELVGFGIDMADLLASELGVTLELVKTDIESAPRLLDAGYLDTMLGGLAVTTDRLKRLAFATPHRKETLAFIVPDHSRQEFGTWESVNSMKSVRLAVPGGVPYYTDKVRARLPQAEIVQVPSVQDFFHGDYKRFDGLVYTAESGSAWSLVYPQFSVSVPQPDVMAVPFAYPVARGDSAMVEFLSTWVELKRDDGTLDRLYAHWVLGKASEEHEPRWSVIRNVFHWVH